MSDEQEHTDSHTPESNPHCPLCNRTFAQESTRKRHFYYCRSKQSDTNTSRKRSCVACARAKTRCTWPADASLGGCNRCNKRGDRCEYDAVIRRQGQGDASFTSGISTTTLDGGQDLPIQESSTALTLAPEFEHLLQLSAPTRTHRDISMGASPFRLLVDRNWRTNVGEIDTPRFEQGRLVQDLDINSTSWIPAKAPGVPIIGMCLSAPSPIPLPSPSLFNTRAFTRPDHVALVSLALRILRSYPSMMVQKGVLPPFMSPRLCASTEAGLGPSQQALINCVGLVQAFRAEKKADKSQIWSRIWFEQERILAEYAQFDRWELLAALQALLVYCLLRLQDTPVGHNAFDVSLLTTVNLVSSAVSTTIAERCEWDLPDEDPKLLWRNWIFNESKRRTMLIFQIINMLVDISTTVSYHSVMGLIFLPLPSPALMWTALDIEGWTTGFKRLYEERTLYGLAEAGALTSLRKDRAGFFHSNVAEWEDWGAEVGDIGTLVMIVATLL
ncbi:hypothetical protein F4677DRAFT_245232 [Hypoxylon crocopeplum]|nr:hypothetical protein F4677DRAFT_245232 [Hypoxylon crocopeplum]